MPDTTPNLGIPYPLSTDPISDYPTVAKSAAEHLDVVVMPVGGIIAFPNAAPPAGWLVCDGQSVTDTNYPKLAQVLGASGTFAVPDLRGRFVLGHGGSSRAAGNVLATGGHQELQQHSHSLGTNVVGNDSGWTGQAFAYGSGHWAAAQANNAGTQKNVSGTQNQGSGNAGNMPPFVIMLYVIRAA